MIIKFAKPFGHNNLWSVFQAMRVKAPNSGQIQTRWTNECKSNQMDLLINKGDTFLDSDVMPICPMEKGMYKTICKRQQQQQHVKAKSLYISRAGSRFYGTEFEIRAGFGQVGSTENCPLLVLWRSLNDRKS